MGGLEIPSIADMDRSRGSSNPFQVYKVKPALSNLAPAFLFPKTPLHIFHLPDLEREVRTPPKSPADPCWHSTETNHKCSVKMSLSHVIVDRFHQNRLQLVLLLCGQLERPVNVSGFAIRAVFSISTRPNRLVGSNFNKCSPKKHCCKLKSSLGS